MHPIDRGAGLALRFLPSDKRVFSQGWGDAATIELVDITAAGPPASIDVEWGRPDTSGALVQTDGRFAAPLTGLPDAAQQGHVLHVAPHGDAMGTCVLLPAWNDEGYGTRLRFATRLAARGLASYVLEAPFYGHRRSAPGGSPVRTVADFALLTRSIVEEGRSLVAGLARTGAPTGVAGYSMGGSLAATVGATLDLPIAVAPLAAAHAPSSVFSEGVLSNGVAWDALEPEGRTRLTEVLLGPSLLRIDPTPATRTAVLVGATRDGFVTPPVTKAIHDHWPGSELRWVRAGHATLLWWHIDDLVQAIADSFARTAASHR
jgi:hypothetical protein